MKIKNICITCGGRIIHGECPYCGNIYEIENNDIDSYIDANGMLHRVKKIGFGEWINSIDETNIKSAIEKRFGDITILG